MRKPISKHALRRALERVREDGMIAWSEPVGTVVDRIWHEIGKKSYNAPRKKPLSRETVRTASVHDSLDLGAEHAHEAAGSDAAEG
jgi:DNA-binding FadR family transcriptional regulator